MRGARRPQRRSPPCTPPGGADRTGTLLVVWAPPPGPAPHTAARTLAARGTASGKGHAARTPSRPAPWPSRRLAAPLTAHGAPAAVGRRDHRWQQPAVHYDVHDAEHQHRHHLVVDRRDARRPFRSWVPRAFGWVRGSFVVTPMGCLVVGRSGCVRGWGATWWWVRLVCGGWRVCGFGALPRPVLVVGVVCSW